MTRILVIGVVAALLLAGWYWFRPERLFIDAVVDEPFPETVTGPPASPATEAVILLSGRFHGVAHDATGVATLYELPSGDRVLRLTEFAVSNGPDVHVYLVAAEDAHDNDTVKRAGFFTLGALKGNKGNQNYRVPAALDLARFRSVAIWCRRFGVNFATAPLVLPARPD